MPMTAAASLKFCATKGANNALNTESPRSASADLLADYLRAGGVGRGSTVAICTPASTDFVVSALAVMSAGAAYLPIDPAYLSDRRNLLVGDSSAALVLTTAEVREEPWPATVPRLVVAEVTRSARLTRLVPLDLGRDGEVQA
jgi:non-ribosomal peptide synthetase component F